jgi:tRNA(fMet)-specific endonuclease VapC
VKRRYLLDTNIASFVIKGTHPHILERLAEHPRSTVAMSVVTEMELRFGVQKAGAPPGLVERVAEFLRAVPVLELPQTIAAEYARVRVDLERAGRPVGALDTIIAAHAATLGAILVTNNVREFGRVKGLRFEDWSRP